MALTMEKILLITALIVSSLCVAQGQFQKMFGQQTVLDGHTGPNDGKILIKSELDIQTTYKPEDCEKVTKNGDTISVEYDAYVNDEHKETSKEMEGVPAGLLEFTIGKRMVIQGLDLGVVNMCVGEKRTIKIPPQLAWGEKGIPGVVPANAVARFEVELVKIEDQSWADWYVEWIQIVCAICFACGAIALFCEKIREKKSSRKYRKSS